MNDTNKDSDDDENDEGLETQKKTDIPVED